MALTTTQARLFVKRLADRDLNQRRIPNIQAMIAEVQDRKARIDSDLAELNTDLGMTVAMFHVDEDVNKPWLPFRGSPDELGVYHDQIQVVADHLGVNREEIDHAS